jgi:hypothetical protein
MAQYQNPLNRKPNLTIFQPTGNQAFTLIPGKYYIRTDENNTTPYLFLCSSPITPPPPSDPDDYNPAVNTGRYGETYQITASIEETVNTNGSLTSFDDYGKREPIMAFDGVILSIDTPYPLPDRFSTFALFSSDSVNQTLATLPILVHITTRLIPARTLIPSFFPPSIDGVLRFIGQGLVSG